TRVAVHAGSLNNPTFTEEQNKKLLLTTIGKLIFNEILPKSFPYINEPTRENLEEVTPEKYFISPTENVKEVLEKRELVPTFKKGYLGKIIAAVFKQYKITETSKMLDRMKDLGFKYSTKSGITISIADIVVLEEKTEILDAAQKKVDNVLKQF